MFKRQEHWSHLHIVSNRFSIPGPNSFLVAQELTFTGKGTLFGLATHFIFGFFGMRYSTSMNNKSYSQSILSVLRSDKKADFIIHSSSQPVLFQCYVFHLGGAY